MVEKDGGFYREGRHCGKVFSALVSFSLVLEVQVCRCADFFFNPLDRFIQATPVSFYSAGENLPNWRMGHNGLPSLSCTSPFRPLPSLDLPYLSIK